MSFNGSDLPLKQDFSIGDTGKSDCIGFRGVLSSDQRWGSRRSSYGLQTPSSLEIHPHLLVAIQELCVGFRYVRC